MKRALALMLCVALAMTAPAALATVTYTEQGERLTREAGRLHAEDRVVVEHIDAAEVHRGVVIEDAQVPLSALDRVIEDLLAELQAGSVESIRILGMSRAIGPELAREVEQIPIRDKVRALLYLLGLEDAQALPGRLSNFTDAHQPLDIFDTATGKFLCAGAVEVSPGEFLRYIEDTIQFGYLTGGAQGDPRIPIIRIPFEIQYAAQGEYAGLDRARRTFEESYCFAYANHSQSSEKHWGLVNVVRGEKDYMRLD